MFPCPIWPLLYADAITNHSWINKGIHRAIIDSEPADSSYPDNLFRKQDMALAVLFLGQRSQCLNGFGS